MQRRIWVRRPDGSATLISVADDSLVDDVREIVLEKYAKSLGRHLDAPDVLLFVVHEVNRRPQERLLGPEENICAIIDSEFPSGQTVNDPIIIQTARAAVVLPPLDHPQRSVSHLVQHHAPSEGQASYHNYGAQSTRRDEQIQRSWSTEPVASHPSQRKPVITRTSAGRASPLVSPTEGRQSRGRREPVQRQLSGRSVLTRETYASAELAETSSTIPASTVHESSATDPTAALTAAEESDIPFAPTVPLRRRPEDPDPNPVTEPLARHDTPIDDSIPAINVLIVEDNAISLRVLQKRMTDLRVRHQTAVNGKIAVEKWRAGGIHLVLMDIQMPVMDGIAATKEIRRLERANGIGVFSSPGHTTKPTDTDPGTAHESEDNTLTAPRTNFKSPVIIVALTASSLQSDRHEALAAGCNDFLTKPVDSQWLEKKVKEWGCMQALVDYEGWQSWKGGPQL